MRMVIALALLVTGSATAAKEASDRPKERKVCRTVEMSGRITPQRICRKVKASATQDESRREARDPAEPPKSGD